MSTEETTRQREETTTSPPSPTTRQQRIVGAAAPGRRHYIHTDRHRATRAQCFDPRLSSVCGGHFVILLPYTIHKAMCNVVESEVVTTTTTRPRRPYLSVIESKRVYCGCYRCVLLLRDLWDGWLVETAAASTISTIIILVDRFG